MSYIGSAPSGEAGTYKNYSDVFSGNGSVAFTLSYNVVRTTDIEVVVNNVQQNPFDGSYSIVNNNILTFSEAPSTVSNNIVVSYKNFSKPVALNQFINATYTSANSTFNFETSTSNVYVVIPSASDTTKGLITVLDSVSNTSITVAASANSVKTAYELAANASSNATSLAGAAYTNAYNQAVLLSANAYSNAYAQTVSIAATAYSNATGYADNIGANAYANAVSVANTTSFNQAANAYANAVSDATNLAANAYANAISVANTTSFNQAANAYANAVSDATNLAANAYANAVSVANTTSYNQAANAYANAVSDATNLAANAYANATSYADAKAANAYANVFNGGTFTGDTTFTSNVIGNNVTLQGSLQIDGSFTVSGGNVLLNAVTLVTEDNMLYLNEGRTANISNITSNGTVVIFTADNAFANGWDIYVYGVTPNTYNGVYTDILEANATHFQVSNTNTDSYTSGGTARAKMEMNPDLGLAGGYNDGTYHHAGVFRDASDGVWKFFHNYTPEPDASVYINTSHASFAYANVQANTFIGNLTGSANSATYLGGNTASDIRNYAAELAANAYSNATSYADTIAGTAYTNATSYAATIAGTAYTNATAFAANADNITSGTLVTARLPATANVATAINVGANVNINTTAYAVGNSTVNTFITATGINTNGTLTANTIVVGNVEQTQTNLNVDPAGTAFLNALIYG